MHFYREPIQVTRDRHGGLAGFTWRGCDYTVERVQNSWPWWDADANPPTCRLYRVAACSGRGHGIVELKERTGTWTLERIWT